MRIGNSCALMLMAVPCALLMAAASASGRIIFSPVRQTETQQKKAEGQPAEVSESENKAAKKVLAASETPAKFKAAAEFLKKYPKSALRFNVAGHLVNKISEVTETAPQITLAEEYLNLFTAPDEANLIYPVLINAYVKANRPDDAFRIAASMLEKNPDDVEVLTQMAITGTQQAQRKNLQYIKQSQTYGAQAISLIEADRKPAALDDTKWKDYKAKWLPELYLSTGILALSTGNATDAQNQLQKAVSLNSTAPFAYALLGNIVNNEYQQMAQQYNSMPAGQAKDEMLKKSEAKLEQAIDLYAQAVALSENNAQYQSLHDQVLQDLRSYYQYLHQGSTDGLQALIDKYKKPSTSQ